MMDLMVIGAVLFSVFFIAYLVTMIHVLINDDLGVFRKFVWVIVMLLVPVLGILLYYLIDG